MWRKQQFDLCQKRVLRKVQSLSSEGKKKQRNMLTQNEARQMKKNAQTEMQTNSYPNLTWIISVVNFTELSQGVTGDHKWSVVFFCHASGSCSRTFSLVSQLINDPICNCFKMLSSTQNRVLNVRVHVMFPCSLSALLSCESPNDRSSSKAVCWALQLQSPPWANKTPLVVLALSLHPNASKKPESKVQQPSRSYCDLQTVFREGGKRTTGDSQAFIPLNEQIKSHKCVEESSTSG